MHLAPPSPGPAAVERPVDLATFQRLRERYGAWASWAVWSEPQPEGPNAARVSDLSVLDADTDPSRLDVLHRRAVLIALNSGVREGPAAPRVPLSMFHDPVGRDFMLAEATHGTPFWGAYLTDFFKEVPTRDGTGLARHLEAHPDKLEADVATLRAELADLGAERPLLVCLGKQVEPYVRDRFGTSHDVIGVSHYSRAMTKDDYRREFTEQAHLLEGRAS